ncbi:hypothetical protein [Roseomonas sp. USHLN139]|uniref:hypothetical protein n=1 Tax=Roseomonas sp. USHLN139 TaxID=3081298 RepID=UPI003B01D988
MDWERQTGVRITVNGADDVAVEAAAGELRARFGNRFAVVGRRRQRSRGAVEVEAMLLVSVTASEDAGAADLLDLLYAGRAPVPAAAA